MQCRPQWNACLHASTYMHRAANTNNIFTCKQRYTKTRWPAHAHAVHAHTVHAHAVHVHTNVHARYEHKCTCSQHTHIDAVYHTFRAQHDNTARKDAITHVHASHVHKCQTNAHAHKSNQMHTQTWMIKHTNAHTRTQNAKRSAGLAVQCCTCYNVIILVSHIKRLKSAKDPQNPIKNLGVDIAKITIWLIRSVWCLSSLPFLDRQKVLD